MWGWCCAAAAREKASKRELAATFFSEKCDLWADEACFDAVLASFVMNVLPSMIVHCLIGWEGRRHLKTGVH